MLGSVQQMVHDNHSEFESKVHSQYAKYLKELPFFTNYFTICKAVSTEDTGLLNIDRLTGHNAPTRYNLIKNFPIFGMEEILLDLSEDSDIGFQTEYEGEGIILPNTIMPQVDDYFILTAVGKHFLFRVTEFKYDTILPKNYYKINFSIKAADDETYYEDFLERTIKTYVCIYDNYGTQDQFIIEEDSYKDAEKLQKLIDEISEAYLGCFYNEKYNCLLAKNPDGINFIYDAFINHFCNEENIFAQNPRNLWNLKFYEELRPEFKFLYHGNSIQEVIIHHDLELLASPRFMKYYDFIPTFTDSIFQFYGDFDIVGITISNRNINPFGQQVRTALPEELITDMIDGRSDTPDLMHNVLVRWMQNDIQYIGKLISNFTGRYRIRPTYTYCLLIPLFLHILYYYKKYLTSSNPFDSLNLADGDFISEATGDGEISNTTKDLKSGIIANHNVSAEKTVKV